MLISYSHKFIFFHVAKVAGSSIKEALKDYAREPEKFKIARPPKMLGDKPNPLYQMWSTSIWHAKARDAKKELEPEVYDDFYKFAFVRNPWDWQVSMYNFMVKEKINEKKRTWVTFEEYLHWVARTKKPYPMGTPKLQKDNITDENGKIIVDFIGRYETLETDFKSVCKTVNIKAKLPHINQSNQKNYREFYNEKTKKIVETNFKEDIDLLGYDFDRYQRELKKLSP